MCPWIGLTPQNALSNDAVRLNIIAKGVGPVTESDVEAAETAGATIVGFNVKAPSKVERMIRQGNTPFLTHRVIYHLLDELKAAIVLTLVRCLVCTFSHGGSQSASPPMSLAS